ncbi:uncharacterized protein KGF55_004266 [Candida pseudojiufengensis]|uniref:uncharacterized protein n=1 Tax=Candida pseudojiufengensis TaxID=497109 RepID=UPI002224785B|nr:uncharacterized protein KGF55_004266 [Candida pseudojiufengensis]KAI5960999.1 hypothetical protein KGF55_004266 [Candida pseudojiufengensis]
MPFKNLFSSRSSSSASLASESSQQQPIHQSSQQQRQQQLQQNHHHQQQPQSHRAFLKEKNGRSISPSSTTSSINSKLQNAQQQQQQQQQVPQINVNNNSNNINGYSNINGQNSSKLHNNNQNHQHDNNSSPLNNNYSPSSSSSEISKDSNISGNQNTHHHLSLKRFLKKFKGSSSINNDSSESLSHKHKPSSKMGKPDPIHPTADLFKKYGTPGKLLGTGASGSVNLLTSKDDPNKIYAVKKFRSRLPAEQENDYQTKVQNEYKVGEYLIHQNIIHTYELIKDYSITTKYIKDPDYYIVMEYCSFDFFNLVMSGLMNTNEIFCYFKQIINGVHFLHENGLAHRDLKLDNCVVNNDGILKLIDFGSAVQFRKEVPNGYYITENDIMLSPKHKLIRARGVVGSDPYLSPEVFEPLGVGYDPRVADVWSIAIIYCCMILKRFPWKLPKLSDPSYRSFAGPQLNPSTTTTNGTIEDDMNNLTIDSRHSHHPITVGPEKLLRLLPSDSRSLIKNMLILDPKKRYLMSDVKNDPFIQSIYECKVIGEKNIDEHTIKSENHQHHLITEDDLKKITQERDRAKRLKEAGLT